MTIGGMVQREQRHLRRSEVGAGALLGVGAAALLVGAGALLLGNARWLSLPRGVPVGIWALVIVTLLLAAVQTRRRLLQRGSPRQVALAIEAEQGMRRGLLVGVLELEGQGALAARAAEAAAGSLPTHTPLAPRLRRASVRRLGAGAALGLAGILAVGAASPLSGDGLRAVLQPIDAWRGALLAPLHLDGAPREAVRGASLAVRVRAPGRARVFLRHRETGGPWLTDTLAVGADGWSRAWTIAPLRADLRLAAADGRSADDSVLVRVVDRPFVGGVVLRASYPRYLARPDETLPLGETLRLPRGTVVAVSGRASVPLARVALSGPEGRIALAVAGQTFDGRFTASRSQQLRWSAASAAGAAPDLPTPLDIDVLADSAPRVAITSPTTDTIVAQGDEVLLGVSATDDHGLASVVLRVARAEARGATTTVHSLASPAAASWAGNARLDLGALRLHAGERLRVRAEAVDASPWAQRGVSREVIVTRPTAEEERASVRSLGDSAVREARAMAAAERGLAQRTDEAARAQERASDAGASAGGASSGDHRLSFEGAEKMRVLAQEQRAMTDRVERLREATRQLARQLAAAGALDTALARQLGEAQALLRQALTPALAAQMQRLEQSAKALDGERSRDALRDLARLQQQMREQLERSAEMLKRAAHEGAMQTLADQAEELGRRERSLADSASSATPTAGAHDAASLAEQSKHLREQIDDLQRRLARDRADAGASRSATAAEHAGNAETAMRRAASELRAGTSGSAPAPAQARAAASEMDAAAQGMREARSAQVQAWKHELTSELDQSVQEMLQLARQERSLGEQARRGASPGERRGAQSDVAQGVDKASERLARAAGRSALLSPRSQRAVADARAKVGQATQQVAQTPAAGGGREQAGALEDAADALTRAAASLARDRERANGARSASGFSEMLEEMQQAARSQGQINGQAQSLLAMPGGAAGAQGQALARSLARQQRGVADRLDDAGEAAGGDQAGQLAREARQLAEQLEGGRLDAGTLARQQQLFRRLLDAGHSLEKEERDDSGRREARAATGANPFAPGAAPPAKAALRFRPPPWEELRSLSPDERRAILDYFTRLNDAPPR